MGQFNLYRAPPFFFSAKPIVPAFIETAELTTNTATYTFSSMNLGTASSDRKIIAVPATRGSATSGTVASVTVAGVTATQVAESVVFAASTFNGVAIYIADVPTGTAGDVVVTYDNSQFRCGVALYEVTGLSSSTAHDTATATSGDPITASINVPAGGFVIGGCFFDSAASATWTGVTESYDLTIESTAHHTGGIESYATLQTGLSVEADFNVNPAAEVLAVASWGP